jgi:hypothetical protein
MPDVFLALLEERITALINLREAYINALKIGIQLATPIVQIELPIDIFCSMSVPDAIQLYLSSIKEIQSSKQITKALKDGGLESTAKDFTVTVTSALHRLKQNGIVERFKNGWSLRRNR